MTRMLEISLFVTALPGEETFITASRSLDAAINDAALLRGKVEVYALEVGAETKTLQRWSALVWKLGKADDAHREFHALKRQIGVWTESQLTMVKRLVKANNEAWIVSSDAPFLEVEAEAKAVLSWGLYEMTEIPNPCEYPGRIGYHCVNGLARAILRLPPPPSSELKLRGWTT